MSAGTRPESRQEQPAESGASDEHMHSAVPQCRLIPTELRRQGAALLHQQCWLWGCDVRRAEGNLLLAAGFSRERVPDPSRGCSAYTLRPQPAITVVLWGWGMFYGSMPAGGLFINRYGFAPQITPAPYLPTGIWLPKDLPLLVQPHSLAERQQVAGLLPAALRWIADYEEGVLAAAGHAYRQGCLAGWRHAVVPAETMAACWSTLAEQCALALI